MPCLDVRCAPVMKSCVAAMTISPLRGVTRFACTPIRQSASARASSVCGKCRFISSPSKSALYGAQTHSLKRKVRLVARARVTRSSQHHSPAGEKARHGA